MTNIEGIKGIIFDYGGTLDSRGVHWSHVIWDSYKAYSVPVTYEQFRPAYVEAERELARVRHIMPQDTFLDLMRKKIRIEFGYLGLADDALADKVAERCYEQARECVNEARPLLDYLYGRYPMVLVSNFYGNVEAVLRDFDLDKYFDTIVESAVVGVRKPDPAIFRLGVEALGLEPSQVLVVGDSYRKDILPAESLGCHTAWLRGPGWDDADDHIKHPLILQKVTDLKAIL